MVILITARPGAGKTTLIKKVAGALRGRAAGFYTEEIRERGSRVGFRLVSLTGGGGVLAHMDIGGPHRVGRYGVDVAGFERFIEAVPFGDYGLAVVDEIGKMECMSGKFVSTMRALLSSGRPLVLAVALKGVPFASEVRKTPGARLFVLDEKNRDRLADEVIALLAGNGDPPGGRVDRIRQIS